MATGNRVQDNLAGDRDLLGTYLATAHGVVEMPVWDGLRAAG